MHLETAVCVILNQLILVDCCARLNIFLNNQLIIMISYVVHVAIVCSFLQMVVDLLVKIILLTVWKLAPFECGLQCVASGGIYLHLAVRVQDTNLWGEGGSW
jgi:hypothetical protein